MRVHTLYHFIGWFMASAANACCGFWNGFFNKWHAVLVFYASGAGVSNPKPE